MCHSRKEQEIPDQHNQRPQQSRRADPRSPLVCHVTTVRSSMLMKYVYSCVWQRQRKKKRERLYYDLWKVASVCVFLIVLWLCVCVCVSKWEGLSVVNLRHSVHQRRSVLFVLLHPSVSDGSLMVMARRALTAGTDATLGWGRPPSPSPPWGVLHAALVVTVHTDLKQKVKKYNLVPHFTATSGEEIRSPGSWAES